MNKRKEVCVGDWVYTKHGVNGILREIRCGGYYGDVAFIATADGRTFYCPVMDLIGADRPYRSFDDLKKKLKLKLQKAKTEAAMNKYKLKKSKESSGFSKEIEAFKYNGDFNEITEPNWFMEAVENGTVVHFDRANNKDKLMLIPCGAVVKCGDYIARKLSGNIGALSEEMLHEYYDIVE